MAQNYRIKSIWKEIYMSQNLREKKSYKKKLDGKIIRGKTIIENIIRKICRTQKLQHQKKHKIKETMIKNWR